MKGAAHQSPNSINKKNKLWRKTIFNMAEGILTLWHDHDIDFVR